MWPSQNIWTLTYLSMFWPSHIFVTEKTNWPVNIPVMSNQVTGMLETFFRTTLVTINYFFSLAWITKIFLSVHFQTARSEKFFWTLFAHYFLDIFIARWKTPMEFLKLGKDNLLRDIDNKTIRRYFYAPSPLPFLSQ